VSRIIALLSSLLPLLLGALRTVAYTIARAPAIDDQSR